MLKHILYNARTGNKLFTVTIYCLLLPCPLHAFSWPLLGGGQYWKFLMIYPYLVLHMCCLGLSVEEVSTGRFWWYNPTSSFTWAISASPWRRSVLWGSDDLILPRPSLVLSRPLLGGGQYCKYLMIYPTLSPTCALLASLWRKSTRSGILKICTYLLAWTNSLCLGSDCELCSSCSGRNRSHTGGLHCRQNWKLQVSFANCGFASKRLLKEKYLRFMNYF
jgi:hypothetical protein